MHVLFVSSVAVIASDTPSSRAFYIDSLGLPLESQGDDDYFHSEHIGGSKHFGLWPLAQAAQACFGTPTWPAEQPVPQVSIEFEVESEPAVTTAAAELESRGYQLLHAARKEPWGQTVARTQTPEGVIIGISYAPWMHTRD
jgi:catechol 2,3-dioxygenase-like lactoylglutathione lyase family enzyme